MIPFSIGPIFNSLPDKSLYVFHLFSLCTLIEKALENNIYKQTFKNINMEESEIRKALREKALKELLKIAAKHSRKLDAKLIAKAFAFAKASHRGQKRLSGKPYFTHPFEVAKIVASLGLDAETISAALLHDVIEDADADRSEIEREFGKQVYFLVDGVTKKYTCRKSSLHP